MKDKLEGIFVTGVCAVVKPGSGQIEYSDAGHLPGLLLRTNGNTEEMRLKEGLPLGIDADSTYIRGTVSLDTGDIVLFFTDGITEAQNSKGDVFGEEKLIESAQAAASGTPDEIVERVLSDVKRFSRSVAQRDDITLFVLKKK